jgi:hypothetical protein
MRVTSCPGEAARSGVRGAGRHDRHCARPDHPNPTAAMIPRSARKLFFVQITQEPATGPELVLIQTRRLSCRIGENEIHLRGNLAL